MALCRVHFQRGLFDVEPVFYGASEYIPYDDDEFNLIIQCRENDILTIHNHIQKMLEHVIVDDMDYELYSIEEISP